MWTRTIGLVTLAALAGACPRATGEAVPGAATQATNPRAVEITGRLGGRSVANARVAVGWVVSSGSPDYVYLYGVGSAGGNRFRVRLDGPPPLAALNSGRLGVGLVILLSDRAKIPQGRLTRRAWRELSRQAIGGAPRFGVIYRKGRQGFRGALDWVRSFPPGYGCGKGARQPGRTFDKFVPTSCGSFEVLLRPFRKLRWVNWT